MAALTLHSTAFLPVINGLKNAHAFISKASTHCTTTSTDPTTLLTASLHPDMKDFRFQVHCFTDAAKFLPIRLNPALEDRELKLPDGEHSFEELLNRIQKTTEHLESYKESDFEGISKDTIVTVKFPNGKGIKLGAEEHVAKYAHPNFWYVLDILFFSSLLFLLFLLLLVFGEGSGNEGKGHGD